MEEGVSFMASMSSAAPVAAPAIHVPAWAWAMAALALFTLYLLAQENGALLPADAAQYLHEFTHDARHALGAPCH
jgi:ABC-type Fe3+-siderophore transport system permease subunit